MATLGHRIISQTAVQAVGKFVSIALGVVAMGMITRALGRAGYGQYATVMAYLQLFGIAVDLGLNVLAPSELAKTNLEPPAASCQPQAQAHSGGAHLDSSRLLSNIFTMRLVAATIAFAAAAAIAFAIPVYDPAVKFGIAAATFSFLGIVLHQILLAPFQVAGRMLAPTIAEVIGRVLLVCGVAVAWQQGFGLLPMVWATVIGNLVMVVIAFVAVQRVMPVRLAFDFALWRRILTKSWPIALSIVFNLVYLRADAVILSLLKPVEDVGIYAAPYRLLDVLTQFPHLVMGLVLPLLAAAWAAGDRAAFARRLQRVFDGLAFLGFPMVAGAIALGTPIMVLVAGAEFSASGPVLGVLALALLSIFLGQPFGYAVVALERQRAMLWGYACVAAVTLIGYLILIPRFSYWGAAWMTVASELMIAVVTFMVVRRTSAVRLDLRIPFAALLAAFAMALAVFAAPAWHLVPRVALGVVVYGLVAVAIPWTRQMGIALSMR